MDFGYFGGVGPNFFHHPSVTQVKFSEFTLGSQPVVLGPIQARWGAVAHLIHLNIMGIVGTTKGISWYKQQSFGNIHGNIRVFLFRCPKYGLMNDSAGLTNASRICACSCPIGFLADDDLTTSDG